MKLLMLVAIVIVSVLGIPVLSDTVKPPSADDLLQSEENAMAKPKHYTIKDATSDITCIILDADIKLWFKYELKGGNWSGFVNFSVPTTNDTIVSGSCMAADNKQMLKLKFHPQIGNKTVEELTPWELELIFANRSSNKAFVLSSISMTLIFDGYFDDAKESQWVYTSRPNDTFIGAKDSGKSFKCSNDELTVVEDKAKLQLIDYRVVAFKQDNSTEFTSKDGYEVCDKDMRTSDIVPIVVGACLAGLVVIVLVAYLIGRARAKRQGYASV